MLFGERELPQWNCTTVSSCDDRASTRPNMGMARLIGAKLK
ncbi:hypothetical protein [Emticicia agri]|nr:hypothetical protein [Emticicia agri]